MSPANIEGALTASPLIGYAVAIGDRRPYNSALIMLDPDALAFHGLADADSDRVRELIESAVENANATLSRVEQIKRFEILPDQWAPDGELVTPTLKLKRKAIAERYAGTIDAMYAEAPAQAQS
jgi:long-subunit acyl-CoA synthetase (AMP-forming)